MNANEIETRDVTTEELRTVEGGWAASAWFFKVLLEVGFTPERAAINQISRTPQQRQPQENGGSEPPA